MLIALGILAPVLPPAGDRDRRPALSGGTLGRRDITEALRWACIAVHGLRQGIEGRPRDVRLGCLGVLLADGREQRLTLDPRRSQPANLAIEVIIIPSVEGRWPGLPASQASIRSPC